MLEKQSNFSRGLNNRYPAHLLPDGFSQEVVNTDLTHQDVRPDKGEGIDSFDPGDSEYYYEAGGSWVGGGGFSATTYNPLTISSDTTISTNTQVAGPFTVPQNITLTVNSGITFTVNTTAQGFNSANSFYEYANDLYISRDNFSFVADEVANSGPSGVCQITTTTDKIGFFHAFDVIVGAGIAENSFVTAIDTGTNKVTLNQAATAVTTTNYTLECNCVPTRIMDGDLTVSFQMGVQVPTPTFTLGKESTHTGASSKNWISESFPVPLQYGVSHIDSTGIESGLSIPSSTEASNQLALGGSTRSDAVTLDIQGLDQGKYFIYRIGDTSAIFKLLEYYYQLPNTASFSIGAASGNNQVISITDTGIPANTTYSVKWFAADDSNSTAAKDNSATKTTSGQTDFGSSTSITLYKNASTDNFFIQVLAKFENDDREYVIGSLVTDGANQVTTTRSYIDFQNARSLANLAPFESSGLPPKNMKFLTEVNNLFFSSVDKVLHISQVGRPNVWPSDGTISFDAVITGLGRRGSELIVFTQFSVYRVFGNSFDSMRKIEIATREGIPDGLHKTISEIRGGLIYANKNGIHYYDGSNVQTLTKSIVGTFTLPSPTNSSNVSGVIDDQYFLLGGNGTTGFKLDLRDGVPKFNTTTLTATNLHYRGLTNRLYSPTGILTEGSDLTSTIRTKDFVSDDLNSEKVYHSITISGTGYSGTITPVIDGTELTGDNVFTLSSIPDLDRKLYLSDAVRGNRMSVKVVTTGGTVQEVGVESDNASAFALARFNFVTITYTGTPTVKCLVDGTEKIAATTLSSPSGIEGQAILYFPAMTEGVIPHLHAVETEANRVVSHTFDFEAI